MTLFNVTGHELVVVCGPIIATSPLITIRFGDDDNDEGGDGDEDNDDEHENDEDDEDDEDEETEFDLLRERFAAV